MDFDAKVESFCVKMKRLQIDGPLMSAKRTLELMRELLTTQKHTDPWSLIDHVKAAGTRLICAKPQELAVGNMVRRVLHLIREVAAQSGATAQKEEEDAHRFASTRGVSLLTLLDKPLQSIPEDQREKDLLDGQDDCSVAETADSAELPASLTRKQAKRAKQWPGKSQVIELLNEVIEEIDLAEDNIIEKATEHIHASEVILTFGLSRTTLKFLIKASERRSFQVLLIADRIKVVVAEGAPGHEGLTMARQLIDAGISTMVIPDSSIFALMARVNKVIVGARAVLATGGILAHSGTRLVALAAHHHRVPFVVIAGLYKLSPLFPHDPQVMFNDFKSPAKFANHNLLSCALKVSADDVYEESLLKLPCPTLDYTAPELIDLLITDTGGYTPSYIYRLLSEYYTREDYVLSVQLLNRLSGY